MDDKGQISAEYLLLIVVILTILTAVTIPLMGQSIDASNDVSWTSDAKVAVETVANAVNIVYSNGPGSKRTFDIYVPKDSMSILVNGSDVSLLTTLSDGTNKTVSASTGYNLNGTGITVNKGWHRIQVYWPIGSNAITVTKT